MARHDVSALQKDLGHVFRKPDLLAQALTHPSASSPGRPDNQRMEFLGDRVLGVIVAEALLEAFPDEPEGTIAPRFNALVRRETLAEVAAEIGIGAHLHLGRSESLGGGRRKAAILADAMEAVIAALYMDGGWPAARAFVLRHWQGRIARQEAAPMDAKTRLQEWVQARGMAPPDYVLVDRRGPDHKPVFTIEARIASGETAQAEAASKRAAEQEAAARLLGALGADA